MKKTKKIDWFELRRKTFHLFLGLFFVSTIYYNLLKWWMVVIILIIGLAVSLISKKIKLPLISWFLEKFERNNHIDSLPGRGVFSIFIGVLLSMILFDKNICLAAIMIWTLGDSVSALVGKHFGTKVHPFNDNRLIEGTIFGIIAGTLGAMFFVELIPAFLAAFTAMIIESIELRFMEEPIDDNILVPLIAGGVLVILKVLFGI
jgi:dolichol kinase